jgi:hypothetical protein
MEMGGLIETVGRDEMMVVELYGRSRWVFGLFRSLLLHKVLYGMLPSHTVERPNLVVKRHQPSRKGIWRGGVVFGGGEVWDGKGIMGNGREKEKTHIVMTCTDSLLNFNPTQRDIYIYVCVCVYIYTSPSLSLSISLYICVYFMDISLHDIHIHL